MTKAQPSGITFNIAVATFSQFYYQENKEKPLSCFGTIFLG
jgi:hypothetical protein